MVGRHVHQGRVPPPVHQGAGRTARARYYQQEQELVVGQSYPSSRGWNNQDSFFSRLPEGGITRIPPFFPGLLRAREEEGLLLPGLLRAREEKRNRARFIPARGGLKTESGPVYTREKRNKEEESGPVYTRGREDKEGIGPGLSPAGRENKGGIGPGLSPAEGRIKVESGSVYHPRRGRILGYSRVAEGQ